MANALLTAYCFALPYPIKRRSLKKTTFAKSFSLILVVSHL